MRRIFNLSLVVYSGALLKLGAARARQQTQFRGFTPDHADLSSGSLTSKRPHPATLHFILFVLHSIVFFSFYIIFCNVFNVPPIRNSILALSFLIVLVGPL